MTATGIEIFLGTLSVSIEDIILPINGCFYQNLPDRYEDKNILNTIKSIKNIFIITGAPSIILKSLVIKKRQQMNRILYRIPWKLFCKRMEINKTIPSSRQNSIYC